MARHLLLEYATRRPFRIAPDLPEGAIYDHNSGCWIKNGEPLVNHRDNGWGTKKCDQETGEDQKGE